jgi:hypothetical protein
MSAADFRALTARKPGAKGKTSAKPPEPPRPQETAAAAALVKRGPVRWAVAEPDSLHAKQYPGAFRMVVVGHQDDLPAVLRALEQFQP